MTQLFIARLVNARELGGKVAIVLTARTPPGPLLCLPSECQYLALTRLTAAETDSMLENAFVPCELDEPSRRHAVERSDGHPLLALELARLYRSPLGRSRLPELLSSPSPLNSILGMRLDQLGSLKPLTQAAAVLGRRFDLRLLAEMLGLDRRVVGRRLKCLEASGVVAKTAADDPWNFCFAHSLLREVAYASVLRENREKLHARAAEILVTKFPATASANPEGVAQHAAAGLRHAFAFVWWRKAAERAIRISASCIAIKHIEHALAARAANPSAASIRDEIDILRLLGPQLSAIHGNASAPVRATYERSLELSGMLEQPEPQLTFDILWGLQTCAVVAGRMATATATSERLVALADRIDSDEARIVAYRVHGLAQLLAGKPRAASRAFGVVHRLYDYRKHHQLRLQYASDQGALALAQDAWALAISGHLDQSGRAAKAALRLADILGHPHTSAHVACVLAARAQIVGEVADAAVFAGVGRSLGETHRFPYWSAWAQIIDGWVEAQTAPDQGVTTIRDGLARYQATGAEQALPYARLLLAQSLLAVGKPTAASGVATEGLRHARANGLLLWEAPLFQVVAACADACGDTDLAGTLRQTAELLTRQSMSLDAQSCQPGPQDRFATASGRLAHSPAAGAPRAWADNRVPIRSPAREDESSTCPTHW